MELARRIAAATLLAVACGVLTACSTQGRGSGREPVAIFIHGWASDASVWEKVQVRLPEPSLAVTLPGHGSPAAAGAISMEGFAEAIEATRAAAGADCIVIVAHSNGAYAAREYVQRYPGHTASLVVVEGVFRPPFTDPRIFESQIANVGSNWPAMQRNPIGLDHARSETTAAVRRMFAATNAATAVQSLQALLVLDPRDDTIVRERVTFLLAASPVWTDEMLNSMRRMAPRSRIEIIPGVSHWVPLDAPQRVANVVVRELGSRRCASPS